jgi:hypothetical protein
VQRGSAFEIFIPRDLSESKDLMPMQVAAILGMSWYTLRTAWWLATARRSGALPEGYKASRANGGDDGRSRNSRKRVNGRPPGIPRESRCGFHPESRGPACGLLLNSGFALKTGLAAIQQWLRAVVKREHNSQVGERLTEERRYLRPLPVAPIPTYTTLAARVRRCSTITVLGHIYSLPSRLIGSLLPRATGQRAINRFIRPQLRWVFWLRRDSVRYQSQPTWNRS